MTREAPPRLPSTSPGIGGISLFQRFTRPDLYIARCGRLDAVITEHHIEDAPEFLRGLRVVFASDMHVLARTTRADLDGFAQKIAGIGPELLLLGGDYSDHIEGTLRLFDALSVLRPPLGIYGVIGNNDYEAWMGRMDKLRSAMARTGCVLLRNKAVDIPYGGGTIRLAGVNEHLYGKPKAARLLSAPSAQDTYRVLLSHYPVLPGARPDLMLCGHTHGGQFNLLGITPYTVGFELLSRHRPHAVAISGLLDMDGMKLLVSKGIGASRLQLRVGVRPEINLLVFD